MNPNTNPSGNPVIKEIKETTTPESQGSSEYDRFEGLTRKLVQTPKS